MAEILSGQDVSGVPQESGGPAPECGAGTPTGDAESDAVSFVSTMSLLFDRFLWWDMLKVVVFSVAGMWLAVFLMSLWIDPTEPVLLPWFVLPIGAGALTVLMIIACLIMGNRWSYAVTLDSGGVSWAVCERERRMNRVLLVLSLLSGKPGPIGANLLATSQQDGAVPWDEVHRVKVHPRQRVVSLMDSWHVVQRLHVPAESWDVAVSACLAGVESGRLTRGRGERSERVRRNPWVVAAGCVVAVVAAVAAQMWDLIPDEGRGPAMFAAVFVLVAVIAEGPVRRIVGLAGALSGVWFLALVVGEALEPFQSFFGDGIRPTWVLDTPQLIVSLAGGAVLAGLGAWRLLGPAPRVGGSARSANGQGAD